MKPRDVLLYERCHAMEAFTCTLTWNERDLARIQLRHTYPPPPILPNNYEAKDLFSAYNELGCAADIKKVPAFASSLRNQGCKTDPSDFGDCTW
jgi:hypothetical protein